MWAENKKLTAHGSEFTDCKPRSEIKKQQARFLTKQFLFLKSLNFSFEKPQSNFVASSNETFHTS